jgi:hypothetical protein
MGVTLHHRAIEKLAQELHRPPAAAMQPDVPNR